MDASGLCTGGASGIARATALALAARGVKVLVGGVDVDGAEDRGTTPVDYPASTGTNTCSALPGETRMSPRTGRSPEFQTVWAIPRGTSRDDRAIWILAKRVVA